MRITSGTRSHALDLTDMEFQIHCMEIEAYGAVLRAFIAQSDVLSWGKEGLISELRKELRVSDVEHREILGRINSDDSIKAIRESRQGTDSQQDLLPNGTNAYGFHSSMANIARKRSKIAHMPMSSSPMYLPCGQPSLTTLPSSLTANVREDPWGINNNILPTHASVGQTLKSIPQQRQTSSIGKGRGSFVVQIPKKGFVHAHSGIDTSNPGFDTIEIRATDKLIDEIEKVCAVENPDPAQIEQAKLMLRDHERALVEALNKLADVPDDDHALDQMHQLSNDVVQKNGHGFQNGVYGVTDMDRGCYKECYNMDPTGRAGVPCIDVQDED